MCEMSKDIEEYNLYSKFDVAKHIKKYIRYLEAVIYPDGTVEYAVPSHQEKLISVLMKQTGEIRKEVFARCPREYHLDFLTWLLKETGCVSIWYEMCIYDKITKEQIKTLKILRISGAYRGKIPTL